MTKFFLFLFITTLNTIWALRCSNPQDLAVSRISRNNFIEIIGNDSGNFCVGWIAEIGREEYFQVAHKLPGEDWSVIKTLSPKDSDREIMDFHLKIDKNGTIYALWDMNWDKECVSNIFFSEKPIYKAWSHPTCLLNDISEWKLTLGLTKDGFSHIISTEFPKLGYRQIEALSFYRNKFFKKMPLSIPTKEWQSGNLFIDNYDHVIACWTTPINEKEIILEYSQNLQEDWPQINKVELTNFDSKGNFFVIGTPDDLAILQVPIFEGKILATSNHSPFYKFLKSFGKENDTLRSVSFATDQEGSICVVWEIKRGDQRGIGIAFKPAKKDWIAPLELFPSEGKYICPKVAEGPDGHYIIAWEKYLNKKSCILGSIFDVKKIALSPISPLSPSNRNCIAPSLFFSKNGTGHIVWVAENDYAATLQVAELFF